MYERLTRVCAGPARSQAPPRSAIERACSMKEELLLAIERLGRRLPPNTLDQLVDELGGTENVAEVPSDASSPATCMSVRTCTCTRLSIHIRARRPSIRRT